MRTYAPRDLEPNALGSELTLVSQWWAVGCQDILYKTNHILNLNYIKTQSIQTVDIYYSSKVNRTRKPLLITSDSDDYTKQLEHIGYEGKKIFHYSH